MGKELGVNIGLRKGAVNKPLDDEVANPDCTAKKKGLGAVANPAQGRKKATEALSADHVLGRGIVQAGVPVAV